ncbi:FkbM family methyltransferase [Bradyrhizobium sp. Pear76]|uniref:FkbM family methyltransferase n=1 Tax=Bradyrhizobium oropedii TaxID=1571201 RepID=UPI001E36715A|nr:FkbM family methyltransferase [Bradyrhizobium oropedii]MCC8966295.1 FkbM family methyltransferase [Bradyrhizobium oropedii]
MASIYTCHNTILYFDAPTMSLRHGPINTSPKNLTVRRGALQAKLFWDDGKQSRLLRFAAEVADGEFSWTTADVGADTPNPIEVVDTEYEFGLRVAGLFISAVLDGSTSTIAHLRDWELFHFRRDYREVSGTIISRKVEGTDLCFLIADPQDWIAKNQLRFGVYERSMLELMRRHAPTDRTFVDIGANVGNHLVYMSRLSGVKRIIAFEPNPEAIKLLRINLPRAPVRSQAGTNFVAPLQEEIEIIPQSLVAGIKFQRFLPPLDRPIHHVDAPSRNGSQIVKPKTPG